MCEKPENHDINGLERAKHGKVGTKIAWGEKKNRAVFVVEACV
jgi:hypothetical protein